MVISEKRKGSWIEEVWSQVIIQFKGINSSIEISKMCVTGGGIYFGVSLNQNIQDCFRKVAHNFSLIESYSFKKVC